MKVHLQTLGCRLNESEVEDIGRSFRGKGHAVVEQLEDADICVINTCAVTNEAGRKSRQLIYQAHRRAPDIQIVVTGCYSQIEREKVESLPGVWRVIDNQDKDRLADVLAANSEHVEAASAGGLVPLQPLSAVSADPKHAQASLDTLVSQIVAQEEPRFEREPLERDTSAFKVSRKTRAYLKVQDGCNNRCTFCVTTIARGAERSRPLIEIVEDAQRMEREGFQEVVLTGVHLGAYGRDWRDEETNLKDLVAALLKHTQIPRIRLSSLEPWNIPEGFFRLWENPRLCRYLHLPLQSGCDATLRRMKRRTKASEFRALVEEIRAHIPGVALCSDMIVGFPGETQEEFAESLAFTSEMDFCHMHVFRYSPRPGTAAAMMPDQVAGPQKSERSAKMHSLSKEGRARFYAQAVGQQSTVLWEQKLRKDDKGTWWQGLTDHYVRVKTYVPRDLHNQLTEVVMEKLDPVDGVMIARLL